MTRFKIVESVPDKNGIIIIAIKEQSDGEFTTRGDALIAIRKMHEARQQEREKVLDEAIAVCQKHYEERYSLSMREHIDGYDDEDLKDVRYLYWQRACGASECASKLQELRKQGDQE